MTSPDPWHMRAECRASEADPALFDLHPDAFNDQHETPTDMTQRHAHALRLCAACPVTAECLADARRHNDLGVRGGMVLVGGNGRSAATREQQSRTATGRALKVLETLTPPRDSFRGLSLSGGRIGHDETPPVRRAGNPTDGVSEQSNSPYERTTR